MRLLNCIKDYLLIGMALAFLWHFSNILFLGSHKIQEPNTTIFVMEVSFVLFVLAFAIYATIQDMR